MNEMMSMSASDLLRNSRSVMDAITAGNHVGITKYKTPHAVVVPAGWYERAVRALFDAEVNTHDGGNE
jgi:antitoxin (DNA-binding transcriptional repressor) of toxin-antitoxin stability system